MQKPVELPVLGFVSSKRLAPWMVVSAFGGKQGYYGGHENNMGAEQKNNRHLD